MEETWKALGDSQRFMNLEGLEPREYQLRIFESIRRNGNTLVVLPTGLGKTLIGAAVVADALSKGKNALFLAPTKPLAEQHYRSLARLLKIGPEEMLLLVGSTSRKDRESLENKARVIVATPQTVANDLRGTKISLDVFGSAVFDECHRTVGKYAYTYIANECAVRDILIVGLTASPGSRKERIKELVEALSIRHIEARSSQDYDVARYVMEKRMHTVMVERSERINEIAGILAPEIKRNLESLNKMGLLHFKSFENIPKGRLLEAGEQIGRLDASSYRFAAMFSYVKLLNLMHAYDLLLTEGMRPFLGYIESLEKREKKSRSLESLLGSKFISESRRIAEDAIGRGEEHAKVYAILDIASRYRDSSMIIFAQYRSTVKMLTEFLNNNGIDAVGFVGKKEGITQEMQKRTIDDFRNGKFRILVASSIGEEGLDIPGVDAVVFYEPIPSEIRNIQRRGRTGRARSGEVFVLVTRGTKDEIYFRVAGMKERKMMQLVGVINRQLQKSPESESRQVRLAK